MGKTIGLITLHTTPNYGSCLQTYATQKTFSCLGWDTVVIDYYRKNNLPENAVEKAFNGRRLQKYQLLFRKAPFIKKILALPMGVLVKRQRRPFDDFRSRYLNLSKLRYSSPEALSECPPEADVYCTGSDQVWNSIWNCGFEEPYYLTFAPEDKKKIAYSASIGREEVDEWEKPLMKTCLEKYAAISMRETSGVHVLNDLGLSDVELVLDPTLMLDIDDWKEIATYKQVPSGDYILVYQLNKSQDLVSYVSALSNKYSLPIVKISYGVYDVQKNANTVIAPSVTDFVGFFMNASYVVTDSFHATAFALNFEKPFVSISPERFSTRITNILQLTETEDRLVKNFDDLDLLKKPIDFSKVKDRLNNKRCESLRFLTRALEES